MKRVVRGSKKGREMKRELGRREFLAWATCGAAMGLASGCETSGSAVRQAAGKRPNLIVIMADDMGAKELSCYGHAAHETPHLDGLGETGVRFETCYATPICHPTRFEIMTGQYGCHNNVYNFAGRRGGPEPGSPEENIGANHVTFAEVLKQQGYATALAGKWQLSGKVPTMIHECGFDEYCIWAYKPYLPEGVEHTGAWEKKDEKPARYWHPCILTNGRYTPTEPDDYGPDIYMDFLIDFMKRHPNRPFLLYYPMCLTHSPHFPTPDTLAPGVDRFKAGGQHFKGVVEYTDTLIGRLVAALDELGLRENTVLFFTGDNGTGGQGKGQPTELGARVPMIVNGPGIVKRRGASGELTDLSDILPTLAGLAGAPLPEARAIDGHSYAGFLRGETDETREWVFSYIGDRRILRTKRWLLEDNSPLHYGRLYDCGKSRDGTGYKDVTKSEDPQVLAIRRRFNGLLEGLPAPYIATDGPAAGAKGPRHERRKGKRGGL